MTFFKRHPENASKPLIDFDAALLLEPSTLLGNYFGHELHTYTIIAIIYIYIEVATVSAEPLLVFTSNVVLCRYNYWRGTQYYVSILDACSLSYHFSGWNIYSYYHKGIVCNCMYL